MESPIAVTTQRDSVMPNCQSNHTIMKPIVVMTMATQIITTKDARMFQVQKRRTTRQRPSAISKLLMVEFTNPSSFAICAQ